MLLFGPLNHSQHETLTCRNSAPLWFKRKRKQVTGAGEADVFRTVMTELSLLDITNIVNYVVGISVLFGL